MGDLGEKRVTQESLDQSALWVLMVVLATRVKLVYLEGLVVLALMDLKVKRGSQVTAIADTLLSVPPAPPVPPVLQDN